MTETGALRKARIPVPMLECGQMAFPRFKSFSHVCNRDNNVSRFVSLSGCSEGRGEEVHWPTLSDVEDNYKGKVTS